MDFYSEHIVKREKTAKDYALMALSALAALLLIPLLALFLLPYIGGLVVLMACVVVYGLYLFLSSFQIEYEYSVTNGELDVDKITSQRKRTQLLSVHAGTFELFAPFDDSRLSAFEGAHRRVDATSKRGAPGQFVAVFYQNNVKTALLFEPTESMRNEFKRHVPRSLFFES